MRKATNEQVAQLIVKVIQARNATTVPPVTAPPGPQVHYLEHTDVLSGTTTAPQFGSPFTINGQLYARGVAFSMYAYTANSPKQLRLNAGRRWQRLVGDLGIIEAKTNPEYAAQVRIALDGNEVFRKDVGVGVTVPLDLDISGVLLVTIEVIVLKGGACCTSRVHLGIGDARFVGPRPGPVRRPSTPPPKLALLQAALNPVSDDPSPLDR